MTKALPRNSKSDRTGRVRNAEHDHPSEGSHGHTHLAARRYRLPGGHRRERLHGIIFMGISGSLVLSVPAAGMTLDGWLSWRGGCRQTPERHAARVPFTRSLHRARSLYTIFAAHSV
ncbi:hypothetical protein D7S65_27740 [Ralstonia insidiosa]|jgi:hypothetical protein|nr:hypothetical protein [Ralstonia insidiosa]MBA9873208.1 hypothetical protein [Ralstonia insidiosa]MBA9916166.1 hypothetical protein [Ralstonia insidiosa]MBA9940152.1 hypothetical protein [Ralstonia insidiosa]MBA9955220.1 hypothetical protein [Ralstonia insidiosa]